MAFWTCPSCGRRVPAYAPACHCGVARTASSALPPRPLPGPVRFTWSDLPWQAWAALAVIVIALGLATWQAFRPGPPERIVPLLGRVDRLPSPTPKPTRPPTARPSPSPSAR